MITRIIKKLGNKNDHSIAKAHVFAEKIVREQFEFELRKYGIEINYAKVLEKIQEIQEIMLP